MEEDIRWKQRFGNYLKALGQLQKFIAKDSLNELEEQGLIQAFEFTHELAWNLLKDYLEYQGNQDIKGSRDTFREAFKVGLIDDGELWMETIKARNITSHAYDEEIVQSAFETISSEYIVIFDELLVTFDRLEGKEKNL